MSDRVFLHVGLPKSGTTYLQAVLATNKQELMDREALLLPGSEWHDHVLAVRDVRRMRGSAAMRREARGAWGRLVKEMSAWSGNSVLSMEWLCAAKPEHIRKIVEDLSPARVEVVFTVRDLGRTLPAAWQEFMQNRGEWPWSEFVAGVSAEDPLATTPSQRFWGQQDLEQLLASWTAVVPVTQTHVVTLPPPGAAAEMLWLRMSEVLGIDGSGYSLDSVDSNVSLGLESAEIMRRLNPLARAAGFRKAAYHQVFKHGIAKKVLAGHRDEESRLGLPVEHHDWARERAAQQITAVEQSGVHVVGDLQDLQPVLDMADARQPEDVSDGELLEVCLAGLVTMGGQWDSARNEVVELGAECASLSAQLKQSQQQVERLEGRVQQFESRPVRSAAALRAKRMRRR